MWHANMNAPQPRFEEPEMFSTTKIALVAAAVSSVAAQGQVLQASGSLRPKCMPASSPAMAQIGADFLATVHDIFMPAESSSGQCSSSKDKIVAASLLDTTSASYVGQCTPNGTGSCADVCAVKMALQTVNSQTMPADTCSAGSVMLSGVAFPLPSNALASFPFKYSEALPSRYVQLVRYAQAGCSSTAYGRIELYPVWDNSTYLTTSSQTQFIVSSKVSNNGGVLTLTHSVCPLPGAGDCAFSSPKTESLSMTCTQDATGSGYHMVTGVFPSGFSSGSTMTETVTTTSTTYISTSLIAVIVVASIAFLAVVGLVIYCIRGGFRSAKSSVPVARSTAA